MPEDWTGAIVGKMHVHRIGRQAVADEMHVTNAYISMVLNGSRKPPGIQERVEKAVDAIIRRQEQTTHS